MAMKAVVLKAAPVALLLLATAVAAWLLRSTPEPERRAPVRALPLVEVQRLEAVDVPVAIEAFGTLRPARRLALVAEVEGRIVSVSSALVEGAVVEAGETLVTLERRDRAIALAEAEAGLAESDARLEEERALAGQAAQEWRSLGRGEASPLTLREPQLRAAEAARDASRARLEQVRLDLERTRIRAPLRARVTAVEAIEGSWVGRGSPLADLHALDALELPLALSPEALALIGEIPAPASRMPVASEPSRPDPSRRMPAQPIPQRRVPPRGIVQIDTGDDRPVEGQLLRIAGIDADSQQITVIARVPLAGVPAGLRAGRFVEVRIGAGTLHEVFAIPAASRLADGSVWLVDEEARLRRRAVTLRWREGDTLYVDAGLEVGDALVLTRLSAAVAGSRVAVEGRRSAGTVDDGSAGDRDEAADSAGATPSTRRAGS